MSKTIKSKTLTFEGIVLGAILGILSTSIIFGSMMMFIMDKNYETNHNICYFNDGECQITKYCSNHITEESCLEKGGEWLPENLDFVDSTTIHLEQDQNSHPNSINKIRAFFTKIYNIFSKDKFTIYKEECKQNIQEQFKCSDGIYHIDTIGCFYNINFYHTKKGVECLREDKVVRNCEKVEVDNIKFTYAGCDCSNMRKDGKETKDIYCKKCGFGEGTWNGTAYDGFYLHKEEYKTKWINNSYYIVVLKSKIQEKWLNQICEANKFTRCEDLECKNQKVYEYKCGDYFVELKW